MKPRNQTKGFTLLEVMIALTIFVSFIAAYVTSQGHNVLDSVQMSMEIEMRNLCESKLNEILINPPELRESLTSNIDKKTFEKFPDYEYEVEFRRIELPDFSQMQGEQDQETEVRSAVEKQVYTQVKKIFKEALWQVQVTVRHKESGFPYSLNTWLMNSKAKMEFNAAM